MKEEIPLKPAQVLGEGKVVLKSEYPAQGGSFPFQAGVDGVLHVDCTRIRSRGGTSHFQIDFGVNPETTTLQVTARQIERLLVRWQQRGAIALTEQSKQFDPGR